MNLINKKISSTYIVEAKTELLPFLLETLHNKSRTAVKSILGRGQVSIDGHTVTQFNHPLKVGQTVEILSNEASRKRSALNGVTILHEDEAVIVINKDAGVLPMGAKNPKHLDAYRQLTSYVRVSNPKNRIFIVHRLDRDTSGVMIYAKTEAAQERLQNNWDTMVKKRLYTALVEGNVETDKGTVSSWLTENKTFQVFSSPFDNGGKHAITHYQKVSGNRDYSLMEVELETGRKNQIRVHMQDLGHPVAGDKKFGAKTNPLKRLALHSTTLEFIHPGTEELVSFTVKAPKGFYRLGK